MKKRDLKRKLKRKELFERFASLFIISIILITLISSFVYSQAFPTTESLQTFLDSDLTVFAIWFSIFFSLIFFSSKKIFGAETNIAAVFSMAVAVLTTVGLLRAFPDIMSAIGTFALILFLAAILLLIYTLVRSRAPEGGGGFGSFRPTLMMIGIAYLIFWAFYKFTEVFPQSFRDTLYPLNDALDIIALVDLAILVILGLTQLSQRVPLGPGPPGTGGGGGGGGGGGPGGGGPGGGGYGGGGTGGGGTGMGGAGGRASSQGGRGGAGGTATAGGATVTINQQFNNQVSTDVINKLLQKEGISSNPSAPALPGPVQRAYKKIRSIYDLKQKYQQYSFSINNTSKSITPLRRSQMLRAMELIIREAEKYGCPQERFLRSGSNGGIGSTNNKSPNEIRAELIRRKLL